MRKVVSYAVLLVAAACQEQERASPTATTAPASASARPSSSAAAEPSAKLFAPPSAIPSGPTHFAVSAPPDANGACKPLAKAKGPIAELAKAVRRLSCEPALFLMTGAALRAELALPADHTLELGDPSSVTIRFPKARASELAAAMGIAAPVAARDMSGAWSWRIWRLRASANLERLDHFSPGIAAIGVAVDSKGIDDKVDNVPLGDAMLEGYLTVTMPPAVLPLKDDDVAVAMLLAGIAKIATDKQQLQNEPAAVATYAGLADDRFRLSRRGSKDKKGIDIWTARTRVPAGPVIESLALKGKIDHRRATDSDDYVLYDGKSDEHAFRGLTLELSFSRRQEASPGPYGEYELEGVTLMP